MEKMQSSFLKPCAISCQTLCCLKRMPWKTLKSRKRASIAMESRSKTSKKSKESFFLSNGGKMLEQIIACFNGKCNPIRCFSEEELKRATNNYPDDTILREDLYHTLHRGVHDGREISVKKFKERSMLDWIVNEVSIASYMSNHGNMFKLLGCCLETELPILVYEYAGKGVLSNYIGASNGQEQELPWEAKLRIAVQIANAIAYLHYGSSKVILHRNINPTNVILGEEYVAKLMDFQLAIPIPDGQNRVVSEFLCGIVDYIAPEIFFTGSYTEKCDVYSFGLILLELLKGKRVKSILHDEFGTNNTFVSGLLLQWNKFFANQLKDNVLGAAGNNRQVREFAELTHRCLKKSPEERPTIKEVSQTLSCIKRLHVHEA